MSSDKHFELMRDMIMKKYKEAEDGWNKNKSDTSRDFESVVQDMMKKHKEHIRRDRDSE